MQDKYNGYFDVVTLKGLDAYLLPNIFGGPNEIGPSWGILTVRGPTGYYLYISQGELRTRARVLQSVKGAETNKWLISNLGHVVFVPFTDQNKIDSLYFLKYDPYSDQNSWTNFVRLRQEDIIAFFDNTYENREKNSERLETVVRYLRRTVSGLDNNDEIYIIPENITIDQIMKEREV